MIAEVIVDSEVKDLNKIFDYIVPKNLEKEIKIGTRVLVPFGKRKNSLEAFVISLKENSDFANKEIEKIDNSIQLSENNIELAKLMSRRYFCNISDCLKLMLPPGSARKNIEDRITDKTGHFVYLKKDIEEIEEEIENIKSAKQKRVLNFLKDNDGTYISDLILITDSSRAVLKTLEKNDYIEIVEEKIERELFSGKDIKRDEPLKLTEEQKNAYDKINYCINNNLYKEFLLYGVTGSRENRSVFTVNR